MSDIPAPLAVGHTYQSLLNLADQLGSKSDQERFGRLIRQSAVIRTKLDVLRLQKRQLKQSNPVVHPAGHEPIPTVTTTCQSLSNTEQQIGITPQPKMGALTPPTKRLVLAMSQNNTNSTKLAVGLGKKPSCPLPPTPSITNNKICLPPPSPQLSPPYASTIDQPEPPALAHRDSAIDLRLAGKELPVLPDNHASLPPPPIPSKRGSYESLSSTRGGVSHIHVEPPNDVVALTPPHSPRQDYARVDHWANPEELGNDLENIIVPITHVQKRINGLKGLLTRTYQMSNIILSRTQIPPLGLYNAVDIVSDMSKAVLKIVITESAQKAGKQLPFDFTFYWRGHSNLTPNRSSDIAKYALLPDAVVKTSLALWIQQQQVLPSLAQASSIFRESLKMYIVYDRYLFTNRR